MRLLVSSKNATCQHFFLKCDLCVAVFFVFVFNVFCLFDHTQVMHTDDNKPKKETRNNGVTIIKNIGFTREGYKNHHYIRSHRTISNSKKNKKKIKP